MSRLIAAAGAAFVLLGSVPVIAAPGGYYTATPAGKISKASLVTRGTLWKCGDGVCSAAKGADRDAIMCELVVQRVGTLSAFSAGGTAFDEAALAKCNARAR